MTNKNSVNSNSSRTAIIRVENKEIELTLVQAQQIANILLDYLETNAQVAEIPMLNSDSGAWLHSNVKAIIDFQNQIRIGSWLLQSRSDEPVLIYRGAQPVSYQYVATLQLKDSQWSIVEISWEKVFSSR